MVTAKRHSSTVTRHSSFFKQEKEEMECQEPCLPEVQERSEENPEDADHETPDKKQSSVETATPSYPSRVMRKPDRYQS